MWHSQGHNLSGNCMGFGNLYSICLVSESLQGYRSDNIIHNWKERPEIQCNQTHFVEFCNFTIVPDASFIRNVSWGRIELILWNDLLRSRQKSPLPLFFCLPSFHVNSPNYSLTKLVCTKTKIYWKKPIDLI